MSRRVPSGRYINLSCYWAYSPISRNLDLLTVILLERKYKGALPKDSQVNNILNRTKQTTLTDFLKQGQQDKSDLTAPLPQEKNSDPPVGRDIDDQPPTPENMEIDTHPLATEKSGESARPQTTETSKTLRSDVTTGDDNDLLGNDVELMLNECDNLDKEGVVAGSGETGREPTDVAGGAPNKALPEEQSVKAGEKPVETREEPGDTREQTTETGKQKAGAGQDTHAGKKKDGSQGINPKALSSTTKGNPPQATAASSRARRENSKLWTTPANTTHHPNPSYHLTHPTPQLPPKTSRASVGDGDGKEEDEKVGDGKEGDGNTQ